MSWRARLDRVMHSNPHTSYPIGFRTRRMSTALHFYQNKQLELYASKAAQRLTLRQLIFFGRSMNEERLIKSANYVRTELPVRIAHRLRDMQTLPYIVVTQEHVARVYEMYWAAFDKFRRYPQVNNMQENKEFCRFLQSILDEHATVIPALSLGLSLSSPHLPPDQLDSFLRRMLTSRISRRVLAEHHIALSGGLNGGKSRRDQNHEGDHVGVIYTGMTMKDSIERCTGWLRSETHGLLSLEPHPTDCIKYPEVIVDGHLSTKFAYIREHFEYIIFELLKNAMYATMMQHRNADSYPPIRATIAASKDDVQVRISDAGGGLLNSSVKNARDLFSFSHIRNTARLDLARIDALRDATSNPQGLKGTVMEQLNRSKRGKSSNEKGPEHKAGVGSHQKMGIGLPLSNIFATYFGGSLELVSLDGWGTDVYLRLPKLGTRLEGIEL